MSSSVLARFSVIIGLLLIVMAFSAQGQQPPLPNDRTKEAQLELSRLNVLRTFKAIVTKDGAYRVSQDDLERAIRADLEKHHAPAVDKVREEYRKNFDAFFERLIKQAVGALDAPDLDLAAWLRKKAAEPDLGQKASLRNVARNRHETMLMRPVDGLTSAYEAARKKVGDEQMSKLRADLDDDKYHPSTGEIERVYFEPKDRADVVRNLVRAFAVKRDLLAESLSRAEMIAQEMVSAGLTQLTGQMTALDAAPTSVTIEGIEKELVERLAGHVRNLKAPAGAKAFGVFPAATTRSKEQAAFFFDAQLVVAAKNLTSQVNSGARKLPDGTPAQIRVTILDSPLLHHDAGQSLRALEDPLFKDLQTAARAWLSEPLGEAARKAKSHFDDPRGVASLSRVVARRLEAKGSQPEKAWQDLDVQLRVQFKTLVVAARKDIADSQAKARCGPLFRGEWKPEESVFLRWDPKELTRADLPELSIWDGKVYTDKEAIEETWSLLMEKTSAALSLGRTAHAGQLALVRDLKGPLGRQIKGKPNDGSSLWVTASIAEATNAWRTERSGASARYPDLFDSSRAMIREIVAEAIGQSAREAQRALVESHRAAVNRRIMADRTPEFARHFTHYKMLVLGDWRKDKLAAEFGGLFKEIDEQMRGVVQALVDARVAALRDEHDKIVNLIDNARHDLKLPAPVPENFGLVLRAAVDKAAGGESIDAELQKQLAELGELAVVLRAQHLVVDRLRPVMQAHYQAKEAPDLNAVGAEYALRVETQWRKDHDAMLVARHPDLYPKVRQRIQGIAQEIFDHLFKSAAVRREDAVRDIQHQFVNVRHELIVTKVTDAVKNSIKVEQSACTAEYIQLVKTDWEKCAEYKTLGANHPHVHSDIVALIHGKVAQLFKPLDWRPSQSVPGQRTPGHGLEQDTKAAVKGEPGAVGPNVKGAGSGAPNPKEIVPVVENPAVKPGPPPAPPNLPAERDADHGTRRLWLYLAIGAAMALLVLAGVAFYYWRKRVGSAQAQLRLLELLGALGPDIGEQIKWLELLVEFRRVFGYRAYERLEELITAELDKDDWDSPAAPADKYRIRAGKPVSGSV
jgi:hypothetical protein